VAEVAEVAEWSVAEVARLSGVTSRTLRHYDAIGLLPPARVGANGYRYYGRAQLLRLQQVLLLRDLGLGLDAIAEVLDGRSDRRAALRRHARWLEEERDRLARLATTVARTLAELDGGRSMTAEQLFDGFDPERQARYEREIAERYGEETVTETRRRTAGWGREQYAQVAREYDEVEGRMADLLEQGVPAGDPRVLDVLDEHHAVVARFWTPDAESYPGLGRVYAEDPRFRERYEARRPGLAEYLRDAMAAYAQARL